MQHTRNFKFYTLFLSRHFLRTKLYVYPLLQTLVTHSSANNTPRTRAASSAAWERLIWSVARVNASWNMSKRAWVYVFS
jgi:hypothetical protein